MAKGTNWPLGIDGRCAQKARPIGETICISEGGGWVTFRSLTLESTLNLRRPSPHHLVLSLGVSLTVDLGFKPDDKGKDVTKDSKLTELRL